jgi:hypothetical protein
MADVFLYPVRLADKLDANLLEAARQRLLINAQKYPVSLETLLRNVTGLRSRHWFSPIAVPMCAIWGPTRPWLHSDAELAVSPRIAVAGHRLIPLWGPDD